MARQRYENPHTLDLFPRLRDYFRRTGLLQSPVDLGVWEYLAEVEEAWSELAYEGWIDGYPQMEDPIPEEAACVARILDAMADANWARAEYGCNVLLRTHEVHSTTARGLATYLLGRVCGARGEVAQAKDYLDRSSLAERALWEYLVETHPRPTGREEYSSLELPLHGFRTRTIIHCLLGIGRSWINRDWPAALAACRQIEDEMRAADLADYIRGLTYEKLGDTAEAQSYLRSCLGRAGTPALFAAATECLRRLGG